MRCRRSPAERGSTARCGARPARDRRIRVRGPSDADERGAAVVDFVLVSLVLVPLVLGIIQVALVMHVHNTLVAAATEGARYAATVDRAPAAGVARTREQIDDALAARFASEITAVRSNVDGVPMIAVHVRAEVPPLGLWGPAIVLDVTGHGVEEAP